ncbi:MFS transporter [Altericroceibacterium spongiae]|uniref:MFS transporter n=1 Tax=Altericroceibacterium spongiae TaxID=2320269 RepID=A0A420ER17_9SPHN|nr:MFS transporter [Altericroceibacterium spongiae]RKF23090.1 MFS transporter [Altericroceibacterium spongiae]
MPPRATQLALPAAILLVACNLRPALAGIGPLLDPIQSATGLGDTGAGLLTTIPVALMGLCLLVSDSIRTRFGDCWGIAIGLGAIALACALRWIAPEATALLASAVLAGVGIAFVQALMPAIIRTYCTERSARLMALYSTGIMGGAMIASTVSPPLAGLLNWPGALGVWLGPALAALAVWVAISRRFETSLVRRPRRAAALHRSRRAWLLLLFFGLGTGAYTLVLAWLPPFYTRLGWSADAAGGLLGFVTLAEVIAGLGVSAWIDRLEDRRAALFAAIAALLFGLLALIAAPLTLAWPAALLLGLGIGALFALSLIVAMDHADNAALAGTIAGFVQGGGYLIAAVLPFAAGLLRAQLNDLTPAWLLMTGLCLALFLIAARFRPGDRIILPHYQTGEFR